MPVVAAGDAGCGIVVGGFGLWGGALLERASLAAAAFGVRKDGCVVVRGFDGAACLIDGLNLPRGCISLPGATGIPLLGDLPRLNTGLGGG